jgi:hypothetical protein
MKRRLVVARILIFEGILLLMAAAIHFAVVPMLRRILAQWLSPDEFNLVSPPFFLNHVVVGVLLAAVGVTTIYSSSGIRAGERWAWVVAMVNGLAILCLPLALFWIMPAHYFRAIPFLVAAILVTLVGLSMVWPLLWIRSEFRNETGNR